MLLMISLVIFLNEYNYKTKLLCIIFAFFYKDQKNISPNWIENGNKGGKGSLPVTP